MLFRSSSLGVSLTLTATLTAFLMVKTLTLKTTTSTATGSSTGLTLTPLTPTQMETEYLMGKMTMLTATAYPMNKNKDYRDQACPLQMNHQSLKTVEQATPKALT